MLPGGRGVGGSLVVVHQSVACLELAIGENASDEGRVALRVGLGLATAVPLAATSELLTQVTQLWGTRKPNFDDVDLQVPRTFGRPTYDIAVLSASCPMLAAYQTCLVTTQVELPGSIQLALRKKVVYTKRFHSSMHRLHARS